VFWTGLAPSGAKLRRAMFKWGAAVAVVSGLAAGGGLGGAAHARGPQAVDSMDVVALATLPREAQRTHQLILSGGPFPYDKDGTVFFNRERLLPPKERGYYREYTVKTPGARNRGARRIVCGGKPPTEPSACYYTADHYASFQRIVSTAP
jgi:ribonuclease T1